MEDNTTRKRFGDDLTLSPESKEKFQVLNDEFESVVSGIRKYYPKLRWFLKKDPLFAENYQKAQDHDEDAMQFCAKRLKASERDIANYQRMRQINQELLSLWRTEYAKQTQEAKHDGQNPEGEAVPAEQSADGEPQLTLPGSIMEVQVYLTDINLMLKALSLTMPALEFSEESVGFVSLRTGVPKLQLVSEQEKAFFVLTIPVIHGRVENAAKQSEVFYRKSITYKIDATKVIMSGDFFMGNKEEKTWELSLLYPIDDLSITTDIASPLLETLIQLLRSHAKRFSGKKLLILDIDDLYIWNQLQPLRNFLSCRIIFVCKTGFSEFIAAKVYNLYQKADYEPVPRRAYKIIFYTQYLYSLIGGIIINFFKCKLDEFNNYFVLLPNRLDMKFNKSFDRMVNYNGLHKVSIDNISMTFRDSGKLAVNIHCIVETRLNQICSLSIVDIVTFKPRTIDHDGYQHLVLDVDFDRDIRAYEDCKDIVLNLANITMDELENDIRELLTIRYMWIYYHLLNWTAFSLPSPISNDFMQNYQIGDILNQEHDECEQRTDGSLYEK